LIAVIQGARHRIRGEIRNTQCSFPLSLSLSLSPLALSLHSPRRNLEALLLTGSDERRRRRQTGHYETAVSYGTARAFSLPDYPK